MAKVPLSSQPLAFIIFTPFFVLLTSLSQAQEAISIARAKVSPLYSTHITTPYQIFRSIAVNATTSLIGHLPRPSFISVPRSTGEEEVSNAVDIYAAILLK